MTLQLLWEEYQRASEPAYKYTSFCVKYRAWTLGLKRSMRQTHIAGERLFLDYAGQTVAVIEAGSGEIRRAQVFVAVLGASNYTFACATATQIAADWVGAIIDALEFIGGVPRLIVPDQTRALIARPDRYEPAVNRLVEEFCDHYDVAVLPARPAHPRDKPKVEVGVQVVERWILARLRNRRFFNLGELNAAIAELLLELNARAFKKLPGCRASAFEVLDRPALRALPANRMPIARFKRARVNIDYHVELDGHYYSVPHRLVRAEVELRVTAGAVEILAGQQLGGGARLERRQGRSHHRRRAHAGVAPGPPRVDAGQADRLGRTDRRGHRCRRALADGAPASPGTRLPRLPGPAAPGAPERQRAAGSGMCPGAVDPLAHLPQRQLDPRRRVRSAEGAAAGGGHLAAARQPARP